MLEGFLCLFGEQFWIDHLAGELKPGRDVGQVENCSEATNANFFDFLELGRVRVSVEHNRAH